MLVVDNGVLLYDESNELCKLYVKASQGNLFAFITFIDKGCPTNTKKYWGSWDWDAKEESIAQIMETGGKCDDWNVTGIN